PLRLHLHLQLARSVLNRIVGGMMRSKFLIEVPENADSNGVAHGRHSTGRGDTGVRHRSAMWLVRWCGQWQYVLGMQQIGRFGYCGWSCRLLNLEPCWLWATTTAFGPRENTHRSGSMRVRLTA